MKKNYDIIIIGAGPVGCVIAEQCASQLNWQVLLIDKRNHIAGNCYDEKHAVGHLIHKYGPHYFRTNNTKLLDYLSQFTDWLEGEYYVKSMVKGELYPFPINLLTINKFYRENFTKEEAQKKLEAVRENIPNPQNSEEFVLSRVGRELYEAFYLGYTLKQWDQHPKDLNKSVCGRIPIRFNEDERYVDHTYQLTPKKGFTHLFANMVKHPNIDIELETDFSQIRGKDFGQKAMVYSGAIDEYFNFKLGKLPWRSLEFELKEYKQEFKQPCVQINYPNDYDYTRSVEIKHITKEKTAHTVVSYEYPKAVGEPYYPIPAEANGELFARYKELSDEETAKNNVYFCGRLATYRYINTDEVIEKALETFERIKNRNG